ncbi:456_t:CDS:2, partial [Entrophospora sp. SA101]
GIKAEIGYLLDGAGASISAIETFAGAGMSIRRGTVAKNKKKDASTHIETVGIFVAEFVNDYHNIHTKCQADTTTTSDVHHFQTILLKVASETPAVPFTNLLMEKNIHNPKGIGVDLVVDNASHSFFPYLWLTYNERKFAFSGKLPEAKNHEEHVEMLLVHNYDNRMQQLRDDRSMNNTKLVNL